MRRGGEVPEANLPAPGEPAVQSSGMAKTSRVNFVQGAELCTRLCGWQRASRAERMGALWGLGWSWRALWRRGA